MHLFSNDPEKGRESLIKIQDLSPEKLEQTKQRTIDYLMEKELLHIIKN